MAQVQVITGMERRRRWGDEEKRAILAAAFAPGAVVTDVARRADINTGLIYRWRQELRESVPGFAKVVVSPGPTGLESCGEPAIELSFGDKAHARIPVSTPAELAAAVVKALSGR